MASERDERFAKPNGSDDAIHLGTGMRLDRRSLLLAGAGALASFALMRSLPYVELANARGPRGVAMHTQTALAILALCTAAASMGRERRTNALLGATLAGAVTAFGLAVLCGGLGALGTSPTTAACLVLLAVGLVVQRRPSHRRFVEAFALPVVFAAFVALVGSAYRAHSPWVLTRARMPPNTALALLLTGGWLASTSESGLVMRELASDHSGGYMARRLLPAALVVPVVLGWLPLLGERSGLYGISGGATVLVVMNAIALCLAIWWSARVANRLDRERVDSIRALEEARVERELRDRFVHALAHDLRNPLTTIRLGAARLAKESSDAERQRSRGAIERATRRLDGMIGDLLDAERLRAGEGLPVRRARRDVVAIACDVVRDQEFLHGARFRLDAPFPTYAEVDEGALRRILENLLVNAWKYGRADAPIEVAVRTSTDEVSLSVHNEGPPIAQAVRERMFEPFARGPRSDEREGWGIGLALVRGLTEAHGGRVEVESTAETGTTFLVRLPLASGEESPAVR